MNEEYLLFKNVERSCMFFLFFFCTCIYNRGHHLLPKTISIDMKTEAILSALNGMEVYKMASPGKLCLRTMKEAKNR